MAQYSHYRNLSPYATTVAWAGDMQNVTYHSTAIVRFDYDKVILNSGGWDTATTKKKMNQASYQFNLGYHVYQKDYDWYVDLPDGTTQPFTDGMEFARKH